MKGGDISNDVTPRLLVVFEGLLGTKDFPEEDKPKRRGLFRKKTEGENIDDWTFNDKVVRAVWDMVWRHKYSVDVVTFLGEEFALALTDRFDEEGIPIGKVTATQPHFLARKLAYMPDVAAVYDADQSRRFTYGSKGYLVDPERPDFFGLF